MFAVIENINLCTNSLGGYNERILGHVTSPVDLPVMIYLLNNLDLQKETLVTTKKTRCIGTLQLP